MRELMGFALILSACTPKVEDTGTVYFDDGGFVLGDAHANVVRQFDFTAMDSDGVADGFNLDGLVSADGDAESCGHGDLVDPQGVPGIDNQLAEIYGVLAPLVGEATSALLQGSINEGRFLLMFELEGIDDLYNDDEVVLNVFRGSADPAIGTLGLIAPDQTFYVDSSIAVSSVTTAIVDGAIEAGPLDFQLPIDILEANFIMPIKMGKVHFEIDEFGDFNGLIGGAISVPEVIGELLETNAREETALVQPIFEANADMGLIDGECELFSMAFYFDGTTGFVVHYPGE